METREKPVTVNDKKLAEAQVVVDSVIAKALESAKLVTEGSVEQVEGWQDKMPTGELHGIGLVNRGTVLATEQLKKFEEFSRDSAHLVERLHNCDIKPVAVLPKTVWDKLCFNANLYRFSPDEKGRVSVNENDPSWYVVGSFIFLPSAVVLTSMAISFGSSIFFSISLSLIFLVLGSFCVYKIVSRIEKLKRIIPDKDATDRLSKLTAKVTFTDPPTEVRKVIFETSKNFKLHIAAHPKAFSLSDVRPAINADPVVYVVNGKAVAVVAQWGDFPAEKKLIQKVVQEYVS